MKQPQHASPLDVTIQWTEHDIPHIKASSYRALGYGYGYAHAHDRLAELSAQAIALRGERSKYFGAERSSTIGFLTTTNLNSDLMYRLRLPQHWVNQAWLQLSKDARDYLQGYVEGLNEYASQLSEYDKSQLFSEEPLVRFHTDDVIRATMRFGIMKELIEIGPHLVTTSNFWQQQSAANEPSPHSQPVGIEGGFGSNGWAFGGDVTENQSAILLANPHSAWKRTPASAAHLHASIPPDHSRGARCSRQLLFGLSAADDWLQRRCVLDHFGRRHGHGLRYAAHAD